jgi:hypothetical protein
MKVKVVSLAGISIVLMACSPHTIKDSLVNDRVKACSAGFSDDTRAQLHASLQKASVSGDINGNVTQETKSLIFAETPVKDHVKVYEDYLKCVEANWNVTNPLKKGK